ncbi:hypothetical protein BDZ88DRAFT_408039 [Geranomyces variabilis]|nr:hypothetical protein BDZ88DRAFT_408039 [Geranomyces variabilis]KAJ3142286.1 hypothetical protein HDU90_004559 [Geranomyces variabilis]
MTLLFRLLLACASVYAVASTPVAVPPIEPCGIIGPCEDPTLRWEFGLPSGRFTITGPHFTATVDVHPAGSTDFPIPAPRPPVIATPLPAASTVATTSTAVPASVSSPATPLASRTATPVVSSSSSLRSAVTAVVPSAAATPGVAPGASVDSPAAANVRPAVACGACLALLAALVLAL